MNPNTFSILIVDLNNGSRKTESITSNDCIGGSSLASLLFEKYQNVGAPWNEQPLIFCTGPLTGYFPLMSKVVCGFCSCHDNEYKESSAGGRAAIALSFCQVDGLVILGKASKLSCLYINSDGLNIQNASSMAGLNVDTTISMIRQKLPNSCGRRSIMTIGSSGENQLAMACINVDEYRHFGRMGGGATMGAKNLKGIILHGDGSLDMPAGDEYPKLYEDIYKTIISQGLQKDSIRSQLSKVHNGACAGCPVGCVHIGYIREKLEKDPSYKQKDFAIDNEPVFEAVKMLGIKKPFEILRTIEIIEKTCLDAISTASALSWATIASEEGIISQKETIVPLCFGNSQAYQQALSYISRSANQFYKDLGQGVNHAIKIYGTADAKQDNFEIVFKRTRRRSVHDDLVSTDVAEIVETILRKEKHKIILNEMVGCLFAQKIYQPELLDKCLRSIGKVKIADQINAKSFLNPKLKNGQLVELKSENIKVPSYYYDSLEKLAEIQNKYLEVISEN